MTLNSRFLIIWVACSLVYLATLAWAEGHGFLSVDATGLWAKSIVQVDGPSVFKSTEAFYPPLPYVLTMIVQSLSGNQAPPAPSLVSAILAGLIVALWYQSLTRKGGFGAFIAAVAVGILGFNPFFLRAVADGPGTVLVVLGTWVYARGLVNLRLSGAAPDMMKVAVGLLLITVSHTYGLLIAFASMPFIVIAARPSMIAASPMGYVLAMFFPVATAIGSLFFVSAIFDSTLLPENPDTGVVVSYRQTLAGLVGFSVVVLVCCLRLIAVPRHSMPLIAAFGTVLGAVFINANFTAVSDPIIATAPMISVAVVAARFWPPSRLRGASVGALCLIGAIVSGWSVHTASAVPTVNWRTAMLGTVVPGRAGTRGTAEFLQTRTDIMTDVERNSELVAALGRIDDLVVAGEARYELALQSGRPTTRFIVVQHDPDSAAIQDRVLRAFERLFDDRMPGYHQVYANGNWMVFERNVP